MSSDLPMAKKDKFILCSQVCVDFLLAEDMAITPRGHP